MSSKNQRKAEWSTLNHHGFAWDSGDISYTENQMVLKESLKDVDNVLVKGVEKCRWFKEKLFSKNVINVETSVCPSFDCLTKNYDKKIKNKNRNIFRCNRHIMAFVR